MTLIAHVFGKLHIAKDVLREMFEKSGFRIPLNKRKPSQTLLKSERQHLYHIYSSLWNQLSWKKLLLVIWKLLGLFVNTLNTDDKYSLLNCDNLLEPIQMQLSKIQKTNFLFFSAFWNFETNMTFITHVFWKLQTRKRYG